MLRQSFIYIFHSQTPPTAAPGLSFCSTRMAPSKLVFLFQHIATLVQPLGFVFGVFVCFVCVLVHLLVFCVLLCLPVYVFWCVRVCSCTLRATSWFLMCLFVLCSQLCFSHLCSSHLCPFLQLRSFTLGSEPQSQAWKACVQWLRRSNIKAFVAFPFSSHDSAAGRASE